RDPVPARDRDAVPPPLTVMRDLVSARAERVGRHVGVGELRLLHEEDVGTRTLEPPRDLVEARLQRVDVPGRDAHASSYTPRLIEATRRPNLREDRVRRTRRRRASLRYSDDEDEHGDPEQD